MSKALRFELLITILLLAGTLLIGCGILKLENETETLNETSSFGRETEVESETVSESIVESESETQESYSVSYAHVEFWTFEEFIIEADYVMEVKCIEIYEDVQYEYAVFEQICSLKGEMEEDTFIVREDKYMTSYVEGIGGVYCGNLKNYEIGQEFLLVFDRPISVYNEYDYCYRRGNIYISKDQFLTSYMHGGLSLQRAMQTESNVCENYETLVEYIGRVIEENPRETTGANGGYIRSEKLEDIVEQTNYIYRVMITDHRDIGFGSGAEDSYGIVMEVLKGEEVTGEINVVVPLDSVITGKEYIFLLSKRTETSKFYTVSSKNSIYSVDDTVNVEKIRELIEQAE